MADEIIKAGGICRELLAELCAVNVRFWLSNKNLRSALIMSGEENSIVKPRVFDRRITSEISDYYSKEGIDAQDGERRIKALRALLIGYVTLIGSGELPNNARSFDELKEQILQIL